MTEYPSLFISHGAPTLLIEDSPARRYLSELGAQLGKPDAIVVLSAHHDSRGNGAIVTTSAAPDMIYDFFGFPDALYQLKYPAPGKPVLGEAISTLLQQQGFEVGLDPTRGLDHGAWAPLYLMYPNADVPVVQVSIDMTRSPDWHYRLGVALQEMRRDGVLIIGSGNTTHNLGAFFRGGFEQDDPAPHWVDEFAEWLAEKIEAQDTSAVINAVRDGPNGQRNHPTLDHIHPLFVALGAGGEGAHGMRLHKSTMYGVLAMDVHGFGASQDLRNLRQSGSAHLDRTLR